MKNNKGLIFALSTVVCLAAISINLGWHMNNGNEVDTSYQSTRINSIKFLDIDVYEERRRKREVKILELCYDGVIYLTPADSFRPTVKWRNEEGLAKLVPCKE